MAERRPAGALSGPDTVLWSIERDPRLRSTVTAVVLLDRSPDIRRLRRRVTQVIEDFPQMRQRIADPPAGVRHPHWVEATDFDLADHFRVVPAPGATRRQLLDMAAEVAESGVDRRRPLWEMTVVEGLDDGRAALIQKFHHSLTDGLGGMDLASTLVDRSRHPRSEAVRPVPEVRPRPRGGIYPAMFRSALHPLDTAGKTWASTRSASRVLAPSGERLSPLFRGSSLSWRFDTCEESLRVLHAAAGVAGGTVNDVFVAAVAGGMHRYHAKLGAEVTALRINLPVSFRQPGDARGGNRFTPVRFVLPVSEPDPLRRVQEVGRICRRWRQEPALPLTELIAELLSRLPAGATTALMGSMLRGVDFVATNVPGLPDRCYVAGAEVERLYAFAPLSGAAVNVALVSHAGTACVGVNMDRVAVVDPDLLMDCLRQGFSEVAGLAG